MMTQSFN